MEKGPEMISTKDLSYISDIFNWHNIMIKKISFDLDYVDDDEICKDLESLKQFHEKACQSLIELLESEAK